MDLVVSSLPIVFADFFRLEVGTCIYHAVVLGGMVYGTESAGAAHAMSQSAGGVHDCAHGALTARLLGPVCEFNAMADPVRYARIAQALGLQTAGLDPLAAALAGATEVRRLTELVGIPTLSELGFSTEEIPMLARMAFEDPQTIGNPRELDVADYEGIYEASFAS
jgi:choline dehydrogenase